MMRLCMLAAAACGRVGFTSVPDAAPTDAVEPLGPFTVVQPLAAANSNEFEDDPALSTDTLELYFGSNRTGDGDIWRSTRPTASDGFGAPVRVTELSTTGEEGYPVMSSDDLAIWFSRASSIMTATRSTVGSPWSTPTVVAELDFASGAEKPGAPFDGDLQLALELDAGGDRNMYIARRTSVGAPWAQPMPIAELTTPAPEAGPFVTLDGLAIYFAAERSGSYDLFVARRPRLDAPFGPAEPIAELNTSGDERDPHLGPGERVIVFSRDGELYIATR